MKKLVVGLFLILTTTQQVYADSSYEPRKELIKRSVDRLVAEKTDSPDFAYEADRRLLDGRYEVVSIVKRGSHKHFNIDNPSHACTDMLHEFTITHRCSPDQSRLISDYYEKTEVSLYIREFPLDKTLEELDQGEWRLVYREKNLGYSNSLAYTYANIKWNGKTKKFQHVIHTGMYTYPTYNSWNYDPNNIRVERVILSPWISLTPPEKRLLPPGFTKEFKDKFMNEFKHWVKYALNGAVNDIRAKNRGVPLAECMFYTSAEKWPSMEEFSKNTSIYIHDWWDLKSCAGDVNKGDWWWNYREE